MSAPFRPDLPHIPGNFPGRGGGPPVYRTGFPTPGEPDSLQPPMGIPIIYPWWDKEMPGSLDWELNALNLSAPASATTVVTGFSLVIPVANRSVLKFLQVTVLNPTTTLNLKFQLLVNNAPVPGWSNVYFAPLNATAFQTIYNDLKITMDEGDTLTAVVVEGSGTAFSYSLQARGWHTPKLVIDSLMNGVKY